MNRQRALVAATFIGVAVLAALVGLIFKFGQHNPSPPSLQDHPNPAIVGEVIYLAPNGCVVRIDASGANKREVFCAGRVDYVLRLDERTIVYGFYGPSGPSATQRDLVSGEERPYPESMPDKMLPISMSGPEQRSALGEFINIDPDGSVYRSSASNPGRIRIFDCDCAEHRVPQFLMWSPDGQWTMLGYPRGETQELWLIARDGSFAGTLAEARYGGSPSWFIPGSGLTPKPMITPVAR